MTTRAAVSKLAPYVPGTSIEEVQRKLGLERIIKLASNENPLGSSPKAMAALQHIDRLHLYFDDAHTELREKIASRYGLHADNVALGHGSNELINVLAETVLEAGDEAVMAEPSFLLYPLATSLRGAHPAVVSLRDLTHDLEAMLAAVTDRTKLVYVCDPNNPTGTALAPQAWQKFLASLPERVVLVIDQAYREYSDETVLDAATIATQRPNTLVLRTMSKIYGLASLRFGYGYADASLVESLNRVRLPFNVSRPAALGAWGALDDSDFVARSIATNNAGKEFLRDEYARMGLRMIPTQANFYALEVPVAAKRAYNDLLERGIIVRSGDALNFPGHLRITIGTGDENRALVTAIEDLLPTWNER